MEELKREARVGGSGCRRHYPSISSARSATILRTAASRQPMAYYRDPSSLVALCIDTIIDSWDQYSEKYLPAAYRLPSHYLQEILTRLFLLQKLSDSTLPVLFSSKAEILHLGNLHCVRNSVLRSIGLSCSGLTYLNLSGCTQVKNSTVRGILQGCSSLRRLYLDGCHRVSDAAFNVQHSPFVLMAGCTSLETLSVQSCPQVTEHLLDSLQKLCRCLRELNIAHCKRLAPWGMAAVGACEKLESLNVSALPAMGDSTFEVLPSEASMSTETLRHLNIGHSAVTDVGLGCLRVFSNLTSLHLQSCERVTTGGFLSLLECLPNVSDLDLRNCAWVDDSTLLGITQHCPALQWVNISWCSLVTDTGVLFFVVSQHLTDLHCLWCTAITDAGVQRLGKQCQSLANIYAAGCLGISPEIVESLKREGVAIILN